MCLLFRICIHFNLRWTMSAGYYKDRRKKRYICAWKHVSCMWTHTGLCGTWMRTYNTYNNTHTRNYTHTLSLYTYIHTYIHIYTHTYIHIHIRFAPGEIIYIWRDVCMYVYVCMYACSCHEYQHTAHICTHTQLHEYIHACEYTCTNTRKQNTENTNTCTTIYYKRVQWPKKTQIEHVNTDKLIYKCRKRPGRVVSLSSALHMMGNIDMHTINQGQVYPHVSVHM
jgi:hypothetical protein